MNTNPAPPPAPGRPAGGSTNRERPSRGNRPLVAIWKGKMMSKIDELNQLKSDTNKVLKSAWYANVPGAINWADLECVEAKKFINDSGEEGYEVIVEEADPSAYDLQFFVGRELSEIGWDNIAVRTEW